MDGLTLHDFELDDRCYAVRLLLALLRLPVRTVAVDMLPGREQTRPPLLLLNPLGTLPVLTDGALSLWDPGAILAYLARQYDPSAVWLPGGGAAFGQVMMWLGFAAGPLQAATDARAEALFDGPARPGSAAAARNALRIMDDHMAARRLAGAAWFVGAGPTIADVALFPAFALSRDYGVEHDVYPALRRWMRHVRGLPGFIAMPGIPSYA